jgi:putative membrane protein
MSTLRLVRPGALTVLSLLALHADAQARIVLPNVIDGQSLATTEAVNSGEILLADLALERSTDPAVLALANDLTSDHLGAQVFQEQLVDELDIVPLPNIASLSLDAQVAIAFQVLINLPPEQFDRAYVDSQIAIHVQVLAVLDVLILPFTIEDDVYAYMAAMRASVADHLRHARVVRDTLD